MKYACFNRPPFAQKLTVQDGYHNDVFERIPKIKQIDNFAHGSPCHYAKSDLGMADKRCDGCEHKGGA